MLRRFECSWKVSVLDHSEAASACLTMVVVCLLARLLACWSLWLAPLSLSPFLPLTPFPFVSIRLFVGFALLSETRRCFESLRDSGIGIYSLQFLSNLRGSGAQLPARSTATRMRRTEGSWRHARQFFIQVGTCMKFAHTRACVSPAPSLQRKSAGF